MDSSTDNDTGWYGARLQLEESGKVLEQCKWTDIYQEDL